MPLDYCAAESCSHHFGDHFPLGTALGKVGKRTRCLLNRKHFVDHWLDTLCFAEFADFGSHVISAALSAIRPGACQ